MDDSGMAEFFNFGEASLPAALDGDPGLAMALPNLSGFDGTDEQW